MRSTAKNPQPRNGTPGRQTAPPPCRNRHTARVGSAAESGPESAANRTSITARIGRLSTPESGQGSAAGFIPRSLTFENFLTTGTVGDGRRPSLMELATFLVSLAQLVVDIIALAILIRRK